MPEALGPYRKGVAAPTANVGVACLSCVCIMWRATSACVPALNLWLRVMPRKSR